MPYYIQRHDVPQGRVDFVKLSGRPVEFIDYDEAADAAILMNAARTAEHRVIRLKQGV